MQFKQSPVNAKRERAALSLMMPKGRLLVLRVKYLDPPNLNRAEPVVNQKAHFPITLELEPCLPNDFAAIPLLFFQLVPD